MATSEKPNLNAENRNAIIFDLSAIVRSKSRSNCLTFDDFANYIYRIISQCLCQKIMNVAKS